MEETIEGKQMLFSHYRSHFTYFEKEFSELDLQNSQKLLEFVTKQSINNTLNGKK